MTSSSPEQQLCRRFSLAEIQSATEDFSCAIGGGGFGKVYKGSIDGGSTTVAVKRMKQDGEQGQREFRAEIETLSRLRHRNIVSLIGYCSEQEQEQGEMILVYEYIANHTLAEHIHNHNSSRNGQSSSLTWTELLNICIAAGRGLDHLHTGSSGSSIIHRDIKSTNILLDNNLVAKVSDFGLAKLLALGSHVSTRIMGTPGYVDPCYESTGRLTMACDTYAFGVVLLEVVSGRRAYDTSLPANEWFLSNWAKEKIRMGKDKEIVASHLRGEIGRKCLNKFLGIAERCLQVKPQERPTMTEVCADLLAALRLQEERRRPGRRLWPFNKGKKSPIRVRPSGLPQDDNNQVGGDILPQVIQGDALEPDQAVPVIPVDELEDRQNANIPLPAISQAELLEITDDFSSKCLIVNGSSGGSLFRGLLRTGQVAAIKRLNKKLPHQEFLLQVSKISGLQHENVVQLLGYCVNGDLQALAYEFAPRGNLYDILHGRPGAEDVAMEPGATLSWEQRIKIAEGAAKGLLHIHEKELIHRSIKSSNVLLFEDGNAKISCVCLTTPQCDLTPKGDVYSFGVVLLELLTGQKPTGPVEQEFLKIWAKPMPNEDEIEIEKTNEDKIEMIVDATFERNYPLRAVEKMAEAAALCLEKEAAFPPDMSTVLSLLEKASWETRTCHQIRQQRSERVKKPHQGEKGL